MKVIASDLRNDEWRESDQPGGRKRMAQRFIAGSGAARKDKSRRTAEIMTQAAQACGKFFRPSGTFRACLKNHSWVAQATRLCRPATRRTEGDQRFQSMETAFWQCRSPQFRSAGRRPGRASRPRHRFFRQALSQRDAAINGLMRAIWLCRGWRRGGRFKICCGTNC